MIQTMKHDWVEDVLDLERELHLQPCANLIHTSTIVCYEEDKLIGFLVWSVHDDFAELLNIGVHPYAQRRHYGQTLLEQWMSMMKSNGIKRLFCEVRSSNSAAINLYKKLGFKLNRVRKDYYDHPQEDAFEMRYDNE